MMALIIEILLLMVLVATISASAAGILAGACSVGFVYGWLYEVKLGGTGANRE